jgi:uncharacterized membrane protein YphA (DoxX/SURF4 family)
MNDADTDLRRWSPATRIAFRFFFSYFVLFYIPWIGLIPFGDLLVRKYDAISYLIVVWLEQHVLHTGYEIYLLDGQGGVSNTPYGTILFFCYVTVAAAATVLWSVLDRRRTSYERLHQWFRLLLRYGLAFSMIHYGVLKVIPTQMISPPPLFVLLRRVGDLTPLQFLWTFIGASPAYETFTGCAELLGGVLLLVPRTTLLGALVCCADMVMVFMRNMCYDVHVKLFSLHLLCMSVLLLAPDLHRLADLFLFNRRVEPAAALPLFARKWLNRAPQVLLLLFGLYRIGTSVHEAQERYKKFHPPRPPLYGAWSVEEFAVDGKDVPLFTDPQRWRWVVFQNPGALTVELMIGERKNYSLHLDMKNRRMRLEDKAQKAPNGQADFSFAAPQRDVLTLDGQLNGHPTHATLRRMPLTTNRVRWIFDPPKEDR